LQAAALDGCAAWLDREGRDVIAPAAGIGFRERIVTADDDRADDDSARRRGPRLIGALYTMIGALALGVGGGWAIDRHFGTAPGWTVGLAMVGMIVGFYHLVRETMR
jgi:F0F1-type ATP synthase assembly protein I